LCRSIYKNIKHIDIDNIDSLHDQKILLEIFDNDDSEKEVIYRKGIRYLYRLLHYKKSKSLSIPYYDYRLVKSQSGLLQDLVLETNTLPNLKPLYVEVEIKSCGLNFRDVLNAMNLYPGDPGPLGGDFAGIVTAIGKDVTDIKLGDEVMGFASGALASKSVINSQLLIQKPSKLNFNEASTIPTAFLTVYLGIIELANLSSNDKVLIHSATGGVGLAAIQIAKKQGSEIFATAGNDEKRSLLRSLGIKHVMDSRSTKFAEEIKAITNGKGIDVVLNTLTGKGFIEATVSICAKNARFIEISKRDIWSPERFQKERGDISYHIVALDKETEDDPRKIRKLLQITKELFEDGTLTPLPQIFYPIECAIEAFELMKQAKHIGKIVVTLSQPQNKTDNLFNPNASYMVTGGLNGIGLKLTEWLVENGARHLILIGRSSPNTLAQQTISRLYEDFGVDVQILQASVSDEIKMKSILQNDMSLYPIKGIFHLAGIIEDAPISKQNWSQFEHVYAPKVQGTLILHHISLSLQLDHFVLFSSVSSAIGNSDQTNYSSANAFMDALAYHRHANGLPALSINWGPWAEVGMAKDMFSYFSSSGILSLSVKKGFNALKEAIKIKIPQVVIIEAYWPTFVKLIPQLKGLLSSLIISDRKVTSKSRAHVHTSEVVSNMIGVKPFERRIILVEHCKKHLKKVLHLPADYKVDEEQGFFEMGMDSLMSMELRNSLQVSLGNEYKVSQTVIFDYPNLKSLSSHIESILNLDSIKTPELNIKKTIVPHNEGFGIIGIACHFPNGGNTPKEFWKLLYDGIDCISEVPHTRWDSSYHTDDINVPGKIYTRYGGFLNVHLDQLMLSSFQ
jgi:NADPH:quinone reductase-like Zn-dependent oxidoreductase/short-subunit dehydrogenase/acyl carrier protein